jgi:hypothetical protein
VKIQQIKGFVGRNGNFFKIWAFSIERLGVKRAKISPTSDVDKIFSKMYSQNALFRNKSS